MIHPENPCLRIDERGGHLFWCPGCEKPHRFTADQDAGAQWTVARWNPLTIAPSVQVTQHSQKGRVENRCHLFIRDGNLQFLNDCTHHLAGKSVPMVPWEDED